ncbi:MAG: tRNA (adenosine(37)-N6)-dimethylallyltransferase MiaA [Candidatus Doudnabacteria bacterium]|nr:tRNA (adenosine(37)-N6)-dimethylallyltransferase MiaA [Candidatus Doudnabacteria bacterium]
MIAARKKFQILVIVGPTSSGKSELAVKLAGRLNGEIISCDSRQIYRGMNLGTGKVPGKWHRTVFLGREFSSDEVFVYKGAAHHCIDFINPKRQYSAAMFQHAAQKSIADVLRRGKLPILCGGTAHWIDAVVYNQAIPNVRPNLKLRINLEKKSVDKLYRQLEKLDPRRASNIDRFNKRRLIRALEIVICTGKPVPHETWNMKHEAYETLWVGINPPRSVLADKIRKRLKQRINQGMIKEVSGLRRHGLSWKRLESFGLEYKFVSLYLQKKITYDELFNRLFIAIRQYSKRQMTWWKRNKNISWAQTPLLAQKLIKL